MRKAILFVKLNILYMFRNKLRFSLTMLGITIGLFIFMLGNVGVNGYINSMYETAYDFQESSFLIYDRSGEAIEQVQSYSDDITLYKYSFAFQTYSAGLDYTYKGVKISNGVELVGVDNGMIGSPIPYFNDDKISVSEANLLYGRDFTQEELQKGTNGIIIEKSTAIFWFQKENAVGESIDVVSPNGYDRFVVIGIIEDLPSRRSANLEFNRVIKQQSEEEYVNSAVAYTTYNYLADMLVNENPQERYIVRAASEKELNEMYAFFSEIERKAGIYGNLVSIVSQRSLVEDVSNLEAQMKGFINIIILAFIIMSGFMIVTIYVFSVKERMYEIGVRRALGASEFDIIYQFIMEGVITAILASVITILLGAVICNLTTAYMVGELYMNIRLKYSLELVLATVGLAVLQGILFSFVPALIASKIRPTEAIRWD